MSEPPTPRRSLSWFMWIAVIVSSILIFTSYAMLGFIFFIWALSRHLPKISGSKGAKVIWVYLGFTSSVIALYSLAWLVHVSIGPLPILVFLALLSWYFQIFRPDGAAKTPGQAASSWISLGVAVLICAFVNLPVLLHPNNATVLRYAAKTGDDINHMAMIEVDRSLGGYLYSAPQKADAYIIPQFSSYPQGWHINGAFFENLIVKLLHSDTANTHLLSFLLYKTLWLGLAAFMSCELLSAIYFLPSSRGRHESLMLFMGALFLGVTLLVSLFGYGFQSFIAALTLLCAGVILALKYSRDHTNSLIISVAILGMASSSVWILTAPMLLVPILYFIYKDYKGLRPRSRPHFHNLSWPAITIICVLMVLSLVPLYVQLRYSRSGSGALDSGGATPPIWWFCVTAIWLGWFWLAFRRSVGNAKAMSQVSATILLEFLGLAIYQQLRFGSQRYYSVKITFLAALVGLAFLLPEFIRGVTSLRIHAHLRLAVFAVVVLLLPLFLGLDVRKSAYPLKDSAPITQHTANIILSDSGPDRKVVILTKSSNESYLATKVSFSLWPQGDQKERDLIDSLSKAVSSSTEWLK